MALQKKTGRKKGTTRKKASTSRAATNAVAITEKSHTPTHLVVFKRPCEANNALAERMGLKDERAIRAGVSLMSHGRAGEAPSRFYTNLGLMIADLTDDEVSAYQQADEVDVVVRNEVRTIPQPVLEEGAADSGSIDPLVAYLQGMHDASLAALRFAGALPESAEARVSGTFGPPPATAAGYPLSLIGMDASYDRFTGQGVAVAVLDTGIDLDHPDFAGRLREGHNAVSFVPGESVQDGNGHGTHCAGTVAGPMASAGGIRYGVAPDVDLLVGKVLNDAGSGMDDQIIDAIDWAATAGARVISMSLGSRRRAGTRPNALYERVARNLLTGDYGALLVAAAGNESARPHYVAAVGNPAAAPSIMAVAAVNQRGRVARFSSGQRDAVGEINVAAPGVQIHSAWTGGGFRSIPGTSMATPHVAGVAALYLEEAPDLSPRALWERLQARARPAGDATDVGHGIVQAP